MSLKESRKTRPNEDKLSLSELAFFLLIQVSLFTLALTLMTRLG
ncbi:MAG TPA: hypothetical protein VM050_11415 [Patescibacteria group bacterium]|nr:hypothetical protein [Patescibacteria group bacterium]